MPEWLHHGVTEPHRFLDYKESPPKGPSGRDDIACIQLTGHQAFEIRQSR
jgi:hypothetical protein